MKALLFDFGNTLAPFNGAEAEAIEGDVARFAASRCGLRQEEFVAAWRSARQEDFADSDRTGREHDFKDRLRRVLTAAGKPYTEKLLEDARGVLIESFIRHVRICPWIRGALRSLAKRYVLGVLSNYLLSEPIHHIVERDGVAPVLRCCVVSRQVGYAKPHRRAFQAALRELHCESAQVAFVGDDFKADILGAHRMGLTPVWTWALCEAAPEEPGECPPGTVVLRTLDSYRSFLQDPAFFLGTTGNPGLK